MKKIIKKLEQKIGIIGLVDKLVTDLSGSDLNTFLLNLFKKKTSQIKPSMLLKQYEQNRFTTPATVNPIKYKENEILWLKSASSQGFHPVLLSPLTQLGSSSVVGCVDQNNVVSALRGSEVVSDATNVLALKVAQEIKHGEKIVIKKYCTTHRHVRGQYYTNPAFSAHFGVFCMVSGGVSRNNHSFEVELAKSHIVFYLNMLSSLFAKQNLFMEIYLDHADKISRHVENEIKDICQDLELDFEAKKLTNQYYQMLQFKVFLNHQNNAIDLADGGFVDWTQKILENKRQRLFISGVGLEIIHKIHQGIL